MLRPCRPTITASGSWTACSAASSGTSRSLKASRACKVHRMFFTWAPALLRSCANPHVSPCSTVRSLEGAYDGDSLGGGSFSESPALNPPAAASRPFAGPTTWPRPRARGRPRDVSQSQQGVSGLRNSPRLRPRRLSGLPNTPPCSSAPNAASTRCGDHPDRHLRVPWPQSPAVKPAFPGYSHEARATTHQASGPAGFPPPADTPPALAGTAAAACGHYVCPSQPGDHPLSGTPWTPGSGREPIQWRWRGVGVVERGGLENR